MSPLAGLTDRPKMFLKIGQIRKGERDPETGKMIDLDYFRVTFRADVNVDAAQDVFKQAYGEHPRSLNVRLAFPTIPEVWDANLECYSKGGMIAKAGSTVENGKIRYFWIFYRDHDTMEVLIRDSMPKSDAGAALIAAGCDPEKPVYTYKAKKKQEDGSIKTVEAGAFLEPLGRLQVVIPEIAQIQVGYFEFRPTSLNDIGNISAELAGIDYIAHQAGKTITGIPMLLRRREEEISKNIGGKLSRGTSWLVHIEPAQEWGNQTLNYLTAQSYPDAIDAEVKQLPAGDEDWDAPEMAPDAEPPAPEGTVLKMTDGKSGGKVTVINDDKSDRPASKTASPDQPKTEQPGGSKREPEKTPGRPYLPTALKARIQQIATAAREKKTEPRKDDEKIINSVIEAAFQPAEDFQEKRIGLLEWLVGWDHDGDMMDYNVVAVYTWLNPTHQTDGTWKADPMAVKEILILAGALETIKKEEAKR
jgi:hypothetical protein